MFVCLVHNSTWSYGGIAKAGFYLSKRSSSLTGFSAELQPHLHMLADGGTVVDKRKVPEEKLTDGVLRGPLLDEGLPPDHVSRFASIDSSTHDRSKPLRSLDNAGLHVYVQYWRDLGARIGRREGDQIAWEDGEREDITPCRCWEDVCLSCHRLRHYVDRDPTAPWPLTRTRKPSGPDDHCPECRKAAEQAVGGAQ